MKKLFYIFFLTCSGFLNAQNNYNCGNDAYNAEIALGFNPVTINSGSLVYIYDTVNRVYQSGIYILIPDKTSTPNGRTVDADVFFGYGNGGFVSDTAFNWDKETIFSPHDFDVTKMFVSPVSVYAMSYSKALQFNGLFCNYGDCVAIVDGPVSGLAYPEYLPANDTFNLWNGEELINAGNLKNTGLTQKVSQQQTLETANKGYCVDKYGPGWRLPTDMEVGHFNDSDGPNYGLDSVYMGTSPAYIWTSSLYITYTVKRWATRITDGYWENCGGFLYVANNVRCVFPGFGTDDIQTVLDTPKYFDHVTIFPNPGSGIFNIANIGDAVLHIYDSFGKLVYTDNGNDQFRIIRLSSFSDGIYFLKIQFDDNIIIKKIIKKKE